MAIHAEFTVEPFVDGRPGPHVQAAIDAAETAGGMIEIGPFGTLVRGEPAIVLDAVDALLRAAMNAGATRVTLQVNSSD